MDKIIGKWIIIPDGRKAIVESVRYEKDGVKYYFCNILRSVFDYEGRYRGCKPTYIYATLSFDQIKTK